MDPQPTLMSVGEMEWPHLKGNTGTGAKAFANQLRPSGYATSVYPNGHAVSDVFNELPTHAITFIHGHGVEGEIRTESVVPNALSALIATIPLTSTWKVDPPPEVREIDDYLPESELDDVLLLIFSACDTADTSEINGNLLDASASKAVDTAVGFTGTVLHPLADNTEPMSFGNYYWKRAASYLGDGATVAQALNKATQDLIAKEGSASDWDTYVIGGASSAPGSTRVSPARSGLSWPAVGLLPGRDVELTAATAESRRIDGHEVVDAVTQNGLSFRNDADTGLLLSLTGAARPTGELTLTEDGATDAARTFARRQLGRGGRITALHTRPSGFLQESKAVTATIVARDDRDLSTRMIVEVDRRSGRVTRYTRAQGRTPVPAQTPVSSTQAERIALKSVPGASALGVELRHWSSTAWVVRLAISRDDGSSSLREVHVDADTGGIVAQGVAEVGSSSTANETATTETKDGR